MNTPTWLIVKSTSIAFDNICTRIETFLREKNVMLFARINHSEAAEKVGLKLQKEVVFVFGNPAVGTGLMVENPAIGIELPLKIVVWQDKTTTQIAYQDVEQLGAHFHIESEKKTIATLKMFMQKLIETITRGE